MSTIAHAQKTDEPQGVEITHELMTQLRARNAEYRVASFGMSVISRESVMTLLEAFDDLSNIVDDLIDAVAAKGATQC